MAVIASAALGADTRCADTRIALATLVSNCACERALKGLEVNRMELDCAIECLSEES